MKIYSYLCNNIDTITNIFSSIESLFVVIAIIVGGFWTYLLFIQKRERYPRANIKHIVNKYNFNSSYLIHIIIEIENISSVLLEIKCGEIRVLQKLPIVGKIKEIIEKDSNEVIDGDDDNLWPALLKKNIKEPKMPIEIEPKEREQLHFDLIIPNSVEIIEIYSYLENVKKEKKEIGWNTTTIFKTINGG